MYLLGRQDRYYHLQHPSFLCIFLFSYIGFPGNHLPVACLSHQPAAIRKKAQTKPLLGFLNLRTPNFSGHVSAYDSVAKMPEVREKFTNTLLAERHH